MIMVPTKDIFLVTKLVTKLLRNIYILNFFYYKQEKMKKYLLLIEDEKLWEKFKNVIEKDINTEIMNLIKKKSKVDKKNDK